MSNGGHITRYLENDILSRPKEWLVPLLFEHLVASLKRSRVQIETGESAGWAVSLTRALSIVFELMGSLNHAEGGELAERLSGLYSFWASEILRVQGKPGESVERLGDLIEMASSLHEAFEQAAEMVAPRGSGRLAVVNG